MLMTTKVLSTLDTLFKIKQCVIILQGKNNLFQGDKSTIHYVPHPLFIIEQVIIGANSRVTILRDPNMIKYKERFLYYNIDRITKLFIDSKPSCDQEKIVS